MVSLFAMFNINRHQLIHMLFTIALHNNQVTYCLQFLYVIRINCTLKQIVMLPVKTVLSLTTDLLAYGAFSHLKDEQVSSFHHLIFRLQQPLTIVQQKLLLTFWTHADGSVLPASLLHRCNLVLQQYGRMPIGELYVEECIMEY